MRFYIVLLLFLSGSLSGQSELPEVKGYSLKACGDKPYAIAQKKSKTGLYDLRSKSFVLKANKSFYHFDEQSGFLFVANASNTVSAYNLNYEGDELCLIKEANRKVIFNKDDYQQFFGNDEVYLTNLEKCQVDTVPEGSTAAGIPNSGLECYENFVLVLERRPSFIDPFDAPLHSIVYPNEDSIDYDGNSVYPPADPAILKSGVYDRTKAKWVVPPQYARVHVFRNFFIAEGTILDEEGLEDEDYVDVYQIKEDGEVVLALKNIKSNEEIPAELFLEGTKFKRDRDPIYFFTGEGTKKGLIKIQFFEYLLEYDYSTQTGLSMFEVDTIFDSAYDFVVKLGRDNSRFVARKGGEFFMKYHDYDKTYNFPLSWKSDYRYFYDSRDGAEGYEIDGKSYAPDHQRMDAENTFELMLSEPKPILENTSMKYFEEGIEFMRDSLIYVQVNQGEDEVLTPLMSEEFWEDSIDIDGNVVYLRPNPGTYESGLYDPQKEEWIFKRKYCYILDMGKGFLLCRTLLDEYGNVKDYVYDFVDNEGNNAFKEMNEIYIRDDINYAKYCLPKYEIDSVFSVDYFSSAPECYFMSGNKMGAGNWMENEIHHHPKDYLWYDPEFGVSLELEGEEIQVKMEKNSFNFNLSQAGLELTFYPISIGWEYDTQWHLRKRFAGTDSTVYFNKDLKVMATEAFKGSYTSEQVKRNFHPNRSFQLKKLNDSLVYIENYLYDYYSDFPLMSEIWVFEDSINEEGDVVYPVPEPGYSRSGVYNYKTKRWFLSPQYQTINYNDGEFIIEHPMRDEFGILLSESRYSILKTDGSYLFKEVRGLELPERYIYGDD
jgi:hypothetical protein